jgi:hypothetical protein
MSEIDNEDYKREYLPLVNSNNKSETQSERGGRINLSDNIGRKTGEAIPDSGFGDN